MKKYFLELYEFLLTIKTSSGCQKEYRRELDKHIKTLERALENDKFFSKKKGQEWLPKLIDFLYKIMLL